jgi:ABC-type Fe3+/spermidine/putrescine transport system ATPase subunit
VIEVESLGKSFGEERALAGVDLAVEDGELCVIVGPSGCGKTTLLHCIAGLVRPDEGDVRRDGESLLGAPVRQRGFGVVFQDFEERLFPHMTVAENVAFGLRQAGEHDEAAVEDRVEEVLELLAIGETGGDYPPNLSGGQQQRVELARQLVRDTGTLLLDDPLSDLDYKLQKRLELELRRLQAEEGDTMLYVTHNQDQSLKLADRLVVMNRGTVEQVGTPAEVYHEPATAFVARFIGDSNLLPADGVARTDGTLTVETPAGPVRADGPGGRAGGATATPDGGSADDGVVVVRPEDVRFGTEGNSVTGTLEQRIYVGELTEFVVSVPAAAGEFRLQAPGDVPLSAVDAAPGETVSLCWAPADTHYFGPGSFSATGAVTATDLEAV